MKERKRKKKLLALIFGTAVLVMAACGDGSDGSGDSDGKGKFAGRTLTFSSWGGAFQDAQTKAYIKPWEKLTGAKVVQESPTDYAKIGAQVKSGNVSIDVAAAEATFYINECGKLLEPIDYAAWGGFGYGTTREDLAPELVNDCGVGVDQMAFAIGWNTKAFPNEHPETWADVWDVKKFPGKRAFWNYLTGAQLEAALLADGVAPKDLYPLDVERALAKLDELRDHIVWYDSGEKQAQLLSSGEVAIAQVWNSRVYEAQKDGQPVDWTYNQYIATWDPLVIPKGSKNVDMAQDFIAYAASVEAQVALSKLLPLAPTNLKAVSQLPESVNKVLPTAPDAKAVRAAWMDNAWYAADYDGLLKRWNAWLTDR